MAKDPREIVVRNLFLIQRYGSSVNDEVREAVNALFEEIVTLLARVDPAGPTLQRYRLARAAKLFEQIEELTARTFDGIAKQVRLRLATFGKQQAQTAAAQLQAILGAGSAGKVEAVGVSMNQLKAIVDTDPMEGVLLKDWFKAQGERTAFNVRRQIQLGLTRGETIDDMVRRVRGRNVGRGNFVGGVMSTTTREAEAIVRTAVNHVSNVAAFNTFQANDDITTSYEYTATLDSRTTLICAALDGKSYRYDDPSAPKPPQHVNCRSIVVPTVDWSSLGLDPPPEGTRASTDGQVSADTKYEDWLKAQPAAAQSEVLGPGRAKLFREGKVSLRDMVKSDGRRVRLDDLAA